MAIVNLLKTFTYELGEERKFSSTFPSFPRNFVSPLPNVLSSSPIHPAVISSVRPFPCILIWLCSSLPGGSGVGRRVVVVMAFSLLSLS